MSVAIEPIIYFMLGIPLIIIVIYLTSHHIFRSSDSRLKGKIVSKVLLVSITGVITLALACFLFFMGMRSEFKNHLNEEYPELSFAVGFIKYDPLYNNYFADVTCLDDHIPFGIGKNSYTKEISDYYSGVKRADLYNSKIKPIFEDSDLKNAIQNVSGGGSSLLKDDRVYNHISLAITADADMISVATRTIEILKENNISAEIVDILQEKDKHVYELSLSPADYSLSKNELEAKIEQRK